MSRIATVLVAAAGLAALVAGCGDDEPDDAGTEEASSVVFPSNCTEGLQERPTEIVVTCADAAVRLRNIRWATWGGTVARGEGGALVNECVPSCAQGRERAFRGVRVQLTRVERCNGERQYTRLALRFGEDTPQGLGGDVRKRFPCAAD